MNSPAHPIPEYFAQQQGILSLGDIPLTLLAERIGQTPFYAYERQHMSARIQDLRRSLPEAIQIHYAIKANPMPAVVQHMAGLVDGLDVASGGELRVALDSGFSPRHISFAGPGKSDTEISQSVAAGICINLESDNDLIRAARHSERLGIQARVAVRVNPDFELKSSGMKMGGGAKQFGIDTELVPDMVASINRYNLDFRGLHIYSGSQNLRAEAIQEAQQKTIELAIRLSEQTTTAFQSINMGGGFGIPYFPGDTSLDVQQITDNLHRLLATYDEQLQGAKIIIELGRYLVGESGIYVCRIIDKKISRGQIFLIVDGGLHSHLAASGNFGQVIRKNYPVTTIGTKLKSAKTEIASVVGPLCTPLDCLADRMELPAADVGDLVVVFQSGAYGLSASPTRFLSHPQPLEILV